MARKAWNGQQQGPALIKISKKVKDFRVALLKWNKQEQRNAGKAINQIKDKINKVKGSSVEARSRELMQAWFKDSAETETTQPSSHWNGTFHFDT
mgnify:FL=1